MSKTLKKITLFILWSTIVVMTLHGNDFYDFAASSDRGVNKELLEIIKDEGIEAAIPIFEGIKGRQDFYVEDLIIAIYTGITPKYKKELLLRFLMDALFDPEAGEEELFDRMLLNVKAFEFLVKKIKHIENYLLKSELFRLLKIFPIPGYESFLMAELQHLNQTLEINYKVNYEIYLELFFIIDLVKTTESPDFIPLLSDLIRFAQNGRVVKKAREAAKYLNAL